VAKCIPIYNGILTERDKKIINEEALIYISDNLIERVANINKEKSYQEFLSIPPLQPKA
jgi:hypothetical protein